MFHFIIIHEAGQQWFCNNITYKDIAEIWSLQGFNGYEEKMF
ncbi:hypothetical protein MHTCC0001_37470 [Flavobacteriaceae bacterium MHTCC 0001]